MPLTLPELAKVLGLKTPNEARSRFNAIRDILRERDLLRRGPHNQVVFTDDAVAIMRRMQELIQDGRTIQEAAAIIRDEIEPEPVKEYATKQDLRILQVAVKQLAERLNELERKVNERRAPLWKRMLPPFARKTLD